VNRAGAIRYIVPFGAGPTIEQGQWLAGKLSARLGCDVVAESHPGRSGVTGTALVAHAPADGSVLLAANPGPLTVAPNITRVVEYDPLRDFAPIALIATVSGTIAVRRDLPAASIGELVSLARKRPMSLTYGSAGVGTVSHLAMVLFELLSDAKMAHRPLNGLAEAVPALVTGAIDVLVIPLPEARPLALRQAIRVLGVTRATRSMLWEDMPTVAESGIEGFETYNWNGMAAPAGTPREIVARFNTAVNDVLSDESAYLRSKGYDIGGGSSQAFGAFLHAEHDKWRKVAAMAHLGAD
jgi:tripartite-type tricarboxylate transporter receptor subunit TctC